MESYRITTKKSETGQVLVDIQIAIASDPDTNLFYWHIENTSRATGFESEDAACEGVWKVIDGLSLVMASLGVEPSTERLLSVLKFMAQAR